MIELILQVDSSEAVHVRAIVGSHEGIEVAAMSLAELYQRPDVDALILGDHLAVEYFLAQPPRTVAEVILDGSNRTRVFVYEATITRANHPAASIHVAASWIVVFPLYAAPSAAAQGVDSAPELTTIRSRDVEMHIAEYPLILNALEVMARQNAAGITPRIHRAALMADVTRTPSVLRAYNIYRTRALAGAYTVHSPGG